MLQATTSMNQANRTFGKLPQGPYPTGHASKGNEGCIPGRNPSEGVSHRNPNTGVSHRNPDHYQGIRPTAGAPTGKPSFDFKGADGVASPGEVKHGRIQVEGVADSAAGSKGKGVVKASDLKEFTDKVKQGGVPEASKGSLWGQLSAGASTLWNTVSGN